MPKKRMRVNNLSTRWPILFKVALCVLYILLFASLIFALTGELWFIQVPFAIIFFMGLYKLIMMVVKLKPVAFDEEFLYIIREHEDLLIPLENIESIKISSIIGVYRVNLFLSEHFGKYFYFKPSLLYPLNFKKKDALVNDLRGNIEQAKRKRRVFVRTLAS